MLALHGAAENRDQGVKGVVAARCHGWIVQRDRCMHHLRTCAGDCWICRRGTTGGSYSWRSIRWTKHFLAVLVVIGEHLAARQCTPHLAGQSPDSRQRALCAGVGPIVLAGPRAASSLLRATSGGCATLQRCTRCASISSWICSPSGTIRKM